MNLFRWATTLTVAFAATFAAAQATTAPKVTEQQRLDSIWYAATNRVSQQADLWYDHGEYLPCIQLLKLETEIFPYDFNSADVLGWLQESTNDSAGALATYIAFRQKNPGDPDGPYMEAMYYFRKQVYAKVPPLLEPLIKLTPPPHPNVYRELAHAYEKMNLLADSKRVWEAYLAVDPSDVSAKTNLDRVEKKLKGQLPMTTPSKAAGRA